MREGLPIIHIESRANSSSSEGSNQSNFINNGTPRRVDQHGALFHSINARRADKMSSVRRRRRMNGNDIRLFKQGIQFNLLNP